MARSALHKRTPRACEHCRQTRRRCEPPYPCRQCIAAGVSCDVRTKARPQRRQQRNGDLRLDNNRNNVSRSIPSGHSTTDPSPEAREHADRRAQSDTFELLKALVQDMLSERHGYVLNCALVEPPLDDFMAAMNASSLLARANTRPPLPLTLSQTWKLLTGFQKFMGWQDSTLVDIEDLQAIACTFVEHLLDTSPSFVSMTVTARCLPVDSVTLLFAVLSLGAVAADELGHGRLYFDISTEMVKHFTGESTTELCLALFLQHVFALRIGTLSYAQSIIVQAIQNAHDLGLHHNTHGIRGLQLYLLIYMADQYCCLTHNTEPIIRISQLQGSTFAPLSQAKPQLRTLIELVTINGYIVEHSHRLHRPSHADVLELESKIGSLCSRLIEPVPLQPSGGGFRMAYEPLARVHMLCCRMKLRAPGLSEQAVWLPSLCICLHAAEGVLSTYFQLHQPVLVAIVKQRSSRDTRTNKLVIPTAFRLATTWRQVKRIMMSAFVVIYAYWHGEMIREEASRYLAMARLLLEYPRWRWGDKLDEAVQTLVDFARLSGFKLYDHTQLLLPGANEQTLLPIHDGRQVAVRPLATPPGSTEDRVEAANEAFSTSSARQNMFDAFSMDDLLGSEVDMLQNLVPFGLWETIECPVESGSEIYNSR